MEAGACRPQLTCQCPQQGLAQEVDQRVAYHEGLVHALWEDTVSHREPGTSGRQQLDIQGSDGCLSACCSLTLSR